MKIDSKNLNSDSSGRIMALDLGEKRIGIAISDQTRSIARPLKVFLRTSRKDDFDKIVSTIEEQGVSLLIVGLPTLPSGEEGSRASWTRDYVSDLARHVQINLRFWDESFSTADAYEILKQQGKNPKRIRDKIDAVAAAVILQSYLDSQS